ncbi:Acid phosphatase/vanadium-dependent haloperoxidase-related protein [Citrus sinensis]|uniref:Acid phosphatase/vanadium-dependent haloperoxidase-related protein n=1 Tax=Citrus sinensis TaxID=2711 RepID=A0ACB8JFB9_CITSI|nr:Acid phosphatase/vanadium-dependent haloperoxidase-related protein [Citrus sinensis]
MVEVITIRDVASLRSGQATKFLDSFPFSSSSLFFPQNLPLISAFLVFALAQFLNASRPGPSYKEKRWDSKRVLNSDGIPWSPSATVSVLAVAIGLQEGSGSSSFTIAIVLACIVCEFKVGKSLTCEVFYIMRNIHTFLKLDVILKT